MAAIWSRTLFVGDGDPSAENVRNPPSMFIFHIIPDLQALREAARLGQLRGGFSWFSGEWLRHSSTKSQEPRAYRMPALFPLNQLNQNEEWHFLKDFSNMIYHPSYHFSFLSFGFRLTHSYMKLPPQKWHNFCWRSKALVESGWSTLGLLLEFRAWDPLWGKIWCFKPGRSLTSADSKRLKGGKRRWLMTF